MSLDWSLEVSELEFGVEGSIFGRFMGLWFREFGLCGFGFKLSG